MHNNRRRKHFQKEDAYPYVRCVLSEDYAYLSEAQLEDTLEPVLGDMSLEEYEDFLRDMSRFGKQAGNVLSRAAPGALSGAMQGATAGAALGPYGMLAGALGGAALGGFQSYQTSQQPRPTPIQTQPPLQQAPTPPPATITTATTTAPTSPYQSSPAQTIRSPIPSLASGSASAQLLSVLTRPETLQALLSMVMAQTGRREIQVGGTQVPVAAFSNLISTLAQRSAVQQNNVIANTTQSTPEYLLDEYGEFICDPMDAEQRADVLLSLINEDAYLQTPDDNEDDEFYDDDDVYTMNKADEEDIFWEDEVEALLAG